MHTIRIHVEERVKYYRKIEVDDETYKELLDQKKIYTYDFTDFLVDSQHVSDSELTDVMIERYNEEDGDWDDVFWETY